MISRSHLNRDCFWRTSYLEDALLPGFNHISLWWSLSCISRVASMPAPDPTRDVDWAALTDELLARCDIVAGYTEENSNITRTFLCEPMRRLHDLMTAWMQAARMSVRRDAIGNLIGHY